jgi:hypothetical protein
MTTLVLGVLACFLVPPETALAGQSQTTSRADGGVRVATLDELRRKLNPGDFISVVQTTGDSVRGRLRRFGDTDLNIQAETRVMAGGPVEWPRGEQHIVNVVAGERALLCR